MSENCKESGRSVTHAYRADQISALIWMLGGAVVILQSQTLDYIAEYGPGPGFLPFWLGVLTVILGLSLLIKATFLSKKTEVIELPTRKTTYQLLLVISAIFAFVLLVEKVGFLICIGLLFFFLLFFVERKGWKFSLIMTLASPIVIWIIFEVALDLRLPRGVIDLFR